MSLCLYKRVLLQRSSRLFLLLRRRDNTTTTYKNCGTTILYLTLVKKRIQPLIRGKQKECCTVASGTPLIIKWIQVQGISIKALIDCGSLVNIISERTVQKNDLLIQEHPESY